MEVKPILTPEQIKEQIKNAQTFIKNHYNNIANEEARARFEKALENIKNASQETADNKEKYAILADACTQWANSLMFTLIQERPITKDEDDDFRTLIPANTIIEYKNTFVEAREQEIQRIQGEQQEIVNRQKGLDIFTAIIGGMSKEDAKAQMRAYEEKMTNKQ